VRKERETVDRRIDPSTLTPVAKGRTLEVATTIHNLSTRPFPAQASYGRRLVRLGAQLCTPASDVTNRDHAQAWLPETLHPGETVDVTIEVPAPTAAIF
jgi:hypothetical protein